MDYILSFNLKQVWEFILNNKDWLFSGIGIILVAKVIKLIYGFICIKGKTVKDLISTVKEDGIYNKCELAKALRIDDSIKTYFSEYSDYLLIQYGSSVKTDNITPNDYDFIVLLLGHPKDDDKEIHHIGSYPDIVDDADSKTKVDVVFRDYNSFLFAACSGMPYENSVILNSKLLHGHQGYYEWLKNITKNILIDRDFLLRRFEDKILTEKKVYDVEKKYGSNKYDLVRSGYYYTTSLLQKKQIANYDKVLTQNSVVGLSDVVKLAEVFDNKYLKTKYHKLVSILKRSVDIDNEITSNDIDDLLKNILEDTE